MSGRTLHRVTLAAAAAGALLLAGAVGAWLDDDTEESARTAASREPLRKTPLLANARDPEERDDATEAEEAREAQLPFPMPDEFRVASPDRALASFMRGWRHRRFGVMRTWTAADSGPDATRRALARRYGPYRIRGWLIRERRRVDPNRVDFDLTVAYRTLLDPVLRRTRFDLRVARRNASGELSPRGSWGVDPVPRIRATFPEQP